MVWEARSSGRCEKTEKKNRRLQLRTFIAMARATNVRKSKSRVETKTILNPHLFSHVKRISTDDVHHQNKIVVHTRDFFSKALPKFSDLAIAI